MPFPLIAGSVAARAASVIGTALANAAAQVSLDAMLDYGLAAANGDGTPATANPVNEIINNVVVNNVLPPQQTNARHEFTLNDEVGGIERGRFVIVPRSDLTTLNETVTAEAVNQTQTTPEGRSGLRAVPLAIRNSHPTANNDSRIQQAPLSNQRAVARQDQSVLRPPIGAAVALALRTTDKADGSRTSLEYHEWKFCCTTPGKHYSILQTGFWHGGTKYLKYLGADYLPPDFAIPWHIWIQYEDVRKLVNITKRYNRLRSRCGGRALWMEQGYADRRAAVIADLVGDSEAQAIGTTLAATSDFDLLP